ncbi:hypothetical protein WDU94_005755, partial [Cyamophila willieti]
LCENLFTSQVSRVVQLWRAQLSKVNTKAGQSLADPAAYENLFPGFNETLRTEQYLVAERARSLPAKAFPQVPLSAERNAVQEMKTAEESGSFTYVPPTPSDTTTEEKLSATTEPAAVKPSTDDYTTVKPSFADDSVGVKPTQSVKPPVSSFSDEEDELGKPN